jgi:hypothetical protein
MPRGLADVTGRWGCPVCGGLVFESLEAAAVRLRFTLDASEPGVITWRNEMAVGDGSWFLIEEYPMVPQ